MTQHSSQDRRTKVSRVMIIIGTGDYRQCVLTEEQAEVHTQTQVHYFNIGMKVWFMQLQLLIVRVKESSWLSRELRFSLIYRK